MSIQIFILSKLMEDNNYPYKLKKYLSEPIPLDKLAGLTENKLYYHFDALAKQGLIEAVEIIKEEHRPDKQVFAITAKGRAALPKKIYKLFEKADGINEMVVSLANIKYVEREKVLEILEKKLADFKARWEYISSLEKQLKVSKDSENLIKFMGAYTAAKSDQTIHWLETLIEQIQQGDI